MKKIFIFRQEIPLLYDITIDPEYSTISNENILSQNGLLLLNPNSNTSLEDTVKYLFRKYVGEPWSPIKCVNFNKNLKRHVNEFRIKWNN